MQPQGLRYNPDLASALRSDSGLSVSYPVGELKMQPKVFVRTALTKVSTG